MATHSGLRLTAAAIVGLLVTAAAGAADVSSNAKSACMQAVNHKYDGRVSSLNVVRSEFSQANSEVILDADGEHWRCLVSNSGKVEELTRQGGKHAAASSGPSNNAESSCMSAINRNYGGKVKSITIVGTEPHPAQDKTVIQLKADGEHWRCVASEAGVVEDLKRK
jgi:hypothetical protein